MAINLTTTYFTYTIQYNIYIHKPEREVVAATPAAAPQVGMTARMIKARTFYSQHNMHPQQ